MAQVLQVPEESSPENLLRHRMVKMESVLQKAERILRLGSDRQQEGNLIAARLLKKRAKHTARHAMSLMGILMIEFGANVTDQAGRARTIALFSKNGQ